MISETWIVLTVDFQNLGLLFKEHFVLYIHEAYEKEAFIFTIFYQLHRILKRDNFAYETYVKEALILSIPRSSPVTQIFSAVTKK